MASRAGMSSRRRMTKALNVTRLLKGSAKGSAPKDGAQQAQLKKMKATSRNRPQTDFWIPETLKYGQRVLINCCDKKNGKLLSQGQLSATG